MCDCLFKRDTVVLRDQTMRQLLQVVLARVGDALVLPP